MVLKDKYIYDSLCYRTRITTKKDKKNKKNRNKMHKFCYLYRFAYKICLLAFTSYHNTMIRFWLH